MSKEMYSAMDAFLALRDINLIKQDDINNLSQGIFTQIQAIALSSI
jgi:hypothetical protein